MGDIFISHASADIALAARVADSVRLAGHSVFLDSDRENGIAPGAAWQRTLFGELRTCDVVVFLNSWPGQASMWCHSELVVAAELGKRVYSLDLAPGLPPHPLLRSLQGIGFDSAVDIGVRRLVGRLESDGLAGAGGLRWERGRPPYPGLAAMDVADAGVFFGREDEVRDLLARVDGPLGQRDGDLVVVIGPSGAGKSSLVRAGLAARLGVPRSGWAVASPFEPGIGPLGRLAGRLAALVPGLDEGECRARLVSEGLAAFGEWLADHVSARRLLIILDQAEHLATVTPSREREEFLSVLGGGLELGSPVTVVLSARSDRFDEVQRLPAIGPAIQAPFVIAPIGRSRLAKVIEGPARRADLAFEPGLVGRLVEDATRGSSGETADALPFLAFVLREMYDLAAAEDRTVLTEADYERAGRIDGAINRRTQAAEAALPPGSGPVLDRMLPQFVALDEERLPAARPVPWDLLTAAEQAIAARLEDHRLLAGTVGTVRLAHEQLLTAWPRLARAVADRRDDLVMQARLERQAADWEHGHGELLGRDATTDASSWLAMGAGTGTSRAAVGEYVRASRAALRRRRAGLVSLLCVIVVVALAASALAVVAAIQRSDAVSQSRLAQSEEMAAEATNLLAANGPLAMLVSLQAYERAPTLQAESALIEAVQQPLNGLLVAGSPVASVAFSPDGRTLATGDNNGDVGLWDVATGHETAILREGGYLVLSVAFSPDGRTLAAGDYGGGVGLWDIATGHETATLREGRPVFAVAFSPDGRTLAAGDYDGDVGLWDMATNHRIATLREGSLVNSVAFSPDGRTLAVGDDGGDVGLWDAATGHKTATLHEGRPVLSVTFSRAGRTLAAGDAEGDVGLWNTATRHKTATLHEASSPVYSVASSPDGLTLAAGDAGGDVGLWDVATGHRTATLHEGSAPVQGVAFSPDGRTLAAGDHDGDVGLWDVVNAQRADLTQGSRVEGVAFSPDGRSLAVGDTKGGVVLWDVATGDRTVTLREGSFLVLSVAFSPDGRTLAVGDTKGGVGLWDVATGDRTVTLREGSPILSVAFSPDGRTLAVGDYGGDVGLWDVATGHRTATLQESGGPVQSVAFSPDGRTLAGGDVGLWDMVTGHRTATLHEGSAIRSVAFSPGGSILVTGDYPGNVDIWKVANGQQIASLPEDDGGARLAFSPDGQVLAIGGLNGTIVLLRQSLAELTEHYFKLLICGKVRHNMTQAQWAQYAPGQPYQQTCS